jgi:hypothetical protein
MQYTVEWYVNFSRRQYSIHEIFISGNLECGKCIQDLSDTLRKLLVNAVEIIEIFWNKLEIDILLSCAPKICFNYTLSLHDSNCGRFLYIYLYAPFDVVLKMGVNLGVSH